MCLYATQDGRVGKLVAKEKETKQNKTYQNNELSNRNIHLSLQTLTITKIKM